MLKKLQFFLILHALAEVHSVVPVKPAAVRQQNDELEQIIQIKLAIAKQVVSHVISHFTQMFTECYATSVASNAYVYDNLERFIRRPSKTTIGVAPVFTNNRKYFANIIGSTAFKTMLADDEAELRAGLVERLKACQEAVIRKEELQCLYERDIDRLRFK